MLAFGIQIAIIATLATTNSILAIAVLFLRMVPLLSDAGRATFLSVQSFGSRLLFAATLLVASANVPDGVELAYGDIRQTLAWYVAAGCGFFVLLWVTAARTKVEPDQSRIT